MHFTGRTWRPPYEAHFVIIQATSGCTYNQCRFCSLYKNECFRMSPLKAFEEDLAEIKTYQPYARRIFWTGANPFAMSYKNLKLRALTVRDYLIQCRTMAMFASIRDIKHKTVRQLHKLKAMGINGLTIGVESGEDSVLALANKGYTAADILEQCRKLDEAGIEYYIVYMTGLAGAGQGERNARASAKLFSRLNPYFISVDSLTLFPDTELYQMARRGLFVCVRGGFSASIAAVRMPRGRIKARIKSSGSRLLLVLLMYLSLLDLKIIINIIIQEEKDICQLFYSFGKK